VIYPATNIENAAAFWASPWAFDGKIYCLDEKGVTHVIKAGETFEELGNFNFSIVIQGCFIYAN
jgi:hypothetical protein